jgi:hypothetical protein
MTNSGAKYTYRWHFQPYVETKNPQYKMATLINSRPFTNGTWILSQPNGEQEVDSNAFRSRPIKHWRKQLMADPIRKGTRHISIQNIETPNTSQTLTTILPNPNEGLINQCDLNEIVGEIELKNNNISDEYSTITLEDVNNCFNGPIGKHLCCNAEKNIIKSSTIPIYKNYTNYIQYYQTKCNTYTQGLSVNKIPLNGYFDKSGYILYPNDNKLGPQSFDKNVCNTADLCNKCIKDTSNQNLKMHNIFKPNNAQFTRQGAVPQKHRLSRLKDQTITAGNGFYNSAYGLKEVNYGACNMNSSTNDSYYIKTKPVFCGL